MTRQIHGIHHVTAIAGDPQRNLDFYTHVLGLRLVKLTVNFDDPGTYHFYFGDVTGGPGTIMTFFPWANARRGRIGNGQVGATAFSIPDGSTGYWQERLKQFGVTTSRPDTRLEEEALVLADPDGLRLELVAHADDPDVTPWGDGPVPAANAIRGFHSVALWEAALEPTARLLTDTLGFEQVASQGNRTRFRMSGTRPGQLVDVIHRPDAPHGIGGAGTVHHVAWRTPSDEEELAWQRDIRAAGYNITPVQDRQYFHSIYFREPGGVLFEIATDPPGFTFDESVAQLGSGLKLPPWLEAQRGQIERILPQLQRPEVHHAPSA
ncbi:MAG: ring-cleaving dioxygenase [Anaerolineae bacterium]